MPEPITESGDVVVSPDVLRDFASRVLVAAGAAKDAAELCAEVFVHADLNGTDSHGIIRLGHYVGALLDGRVDGRARPEVVSERGSALAVDARNGLGPVGLAFATDLAVRAAGEHGVAAVTVRGSNHAGGMAWYTDRAAAAGRFALVLTRSTRAMVAPRNGATPFLGTNAVAYGMPAGPRTVSFDAATSATSRSRVEAYRRQGRRLPEGWALGPDGAPALDPAEVLDGIDRLTGHSLLPFGGTDGAHKGFGLGLLVELLCGPLAGAHWGPPALVPPDVPAGPAGVGHFVLCLDLGAFGEPAHDVERRMAAFDAALHTVPAATAGVPVRVPGDRRRGCADQRKQAGIPIPADVLAVLDATAALVAMPTLTTDR